MSTDQAGGVGEDLEGYPGHPKPALPCPTFKAGVEEASLQDLSLGPSKMGLSASPYK